MIDADTIVIPAEHPTIKRKLIDLKGAQFLGVKRGEIGYWPVHSLASADRLNDKPLTEEVIEAAVTASMFGWHLTAITKPVHDWLIARAEGDLS